VAASLAIGAAPSGGCTTTTVNFVVTDGGSTDVSPDGADGSDAEDPFDLVGGVIDAGALGDGAPADGGAGDGLPAGASFAPRRKPIAE
jgi:hypothetical protein